MMIAAAAVAFFLFCFFFLSLWKPVDLWKTSISVRLGWSDCSLLWHSLRAVCDRPARPGLATNTLPYLSKVTARFSSEAAAGDYGRILRWCLWKTHYKDYVVSGASG